MDALRTMTGGTKIKRRYLLPMMYPKEDQQRTVRDNMGLVRTVVVRTGAGSLIILDTVLLNGRRENSAG